ncbi:MAG: hypothetical protein HQ482_02575 [Sphingomonadales bacterium]|nr:hypothetical protein [Sphingomonadales bacterium]
MVIGISFHSDETTVAWLKNLSEAITPVQAQVQVMVVDNTIRDSSDEFFAKLREIMPSIQTLKALTNLGYFGGAHAGLDEWQRRGGGLPLWVMVSNVDVTYPEQELFTHLLDTKYPNDTAVIGPSIWSLARRGDWNPKITHRPSRRRMHAYKSLYRSHWLFNLYEQGSRIKFALSKIIRIIRGAVVEKGKSDGLQDIYAPHGACMLFSREYFARGGDLRYPGFLFGEEIFVAETANKLGLRIYFDPALKMTSADHVSTGRFRSKKIVKFMHDSAVLLADRYFP